MKKIAFFLLLACLGFSKAALAQTPEEEAEVLYENAEKAYDNKDYAACEIALDKCIQKLGSTNPKIDYLRIRNLYDEITDDEYKATLDNYALLQNVITDFFQKVNKSVYPEEKYKQVIAVKLAITDKMATATADPNAMKMHAVNSMNEILRQYSNHENNVKTWSSAQANVVLNDCVLTLTKTLIYSKEVNSNGINGYKVTFKIVLPSVYTKNDSVLYSNVLGNINITDYDVKIKSRGRDTSLKIKGTQNIGVLNPRNFLIGTDKSVSIANQYGEEFIKAVLFLMNDCGGGK